MFEKRPAGGSIDVTESDSVIEAIARAPARDPSTAASASEFSLPARFRAIRRLGEGGMGIVFEVHDEERCARVALKTIRAMTPDALARFKREFRAVADLHHPNLVRLDELISEGSEWFFTMELVSGGSFLEYVRTARGSASPTWAQDTVVHVAGARSSLPGEAENRATLPSAGGFDEARLRDAFGQLARGLSALHDARLVHRDVKPSNAMVDDDGRVVVLDFGLVATAEGVASTDHVVGTPAYMAPEQAASKPVGPEADWYAAGVMLYEALTGVLPFEGSPLEMLMSKQQGDVPPPSTRCSGIAPDLDSLCAALLRFEPSRRPDGPRVLSALGLHGGAPVALRSQTRTARSPFVGRADELAALRRAFEDSRGGGPVVMLVSGESGVGKSHLVRTFIEQLIAGDANVVALDGRCYEREDVPFKAFDGAIDALSRALIKLPDVRAAALVPRRVGALLQVFPVLRRVRAFSSEVLDVRSGLAPLELRQRAFSALRELFARIADQRPLVVLIDDLQWADADSMALLADVLGPPEPPGLLLLGTVRSESGDEQPSDLGMALRGALPRATRRIHLRRLSFDDARTLAEKLLRQQTFGDPGDDASAIARETAGHPLFIDELVRYRAMTGAVAPALKLEEALGSRFASLDPVAARVLELVVVAGAPIAQDTVARAAGIELGAMSRTTSLLRVANLARTAGARVGDAVEPYHDRVREAVLGRLDATQIRLDHERLALALEATTNVDVEALSVHWAAAGKADVAAEHALTAAEQAAKALAFDRSARSYERALELLPASDPRRHVLHVALGEALANAGRCARAAASFGAAAEGANEADALDLRRRAADQLLRAGHTDDGLAMMRIVLASVGMSLQPSARMATLLFILGSLFLRLRGVRYRPRDPSQIAPGELTRIDVCWSVTIGLAFVDHLRSAMFQKRHLRLALRAGDPLRVALGLSMHGVFVARTGAKAWPAAEAHLARAKELAQQTKDPFAIGHVSFTTGMSCVFTGRFRQALAACDEAMDVWRESAKGAGWDASTARLYALTALVHLGELAEVCRRQPAYLRNARERGDLYGATNLRIGHASIVWLVADDVASGREDVLAASKSLPGKGFHVEHYFAWYSLTNVDLYDGNAAEAYARSSQCWRLYLGSMIRSVELIRLVAAQTRARSAIALARIDPTQRSALLGVAEESARRIDREEVAWAKPIAALLRSGAFVVRGETERAKPLLEGAIGAFESSDMRLYAAVARRALGSLLLGEEGRTLVVTADAWMGAQGVRNPERLAATFVPGISMAVDAVGAHAAVSR